MGDGLRYEPFAALKTLDCKRGAKRSPVVRDDQVEVSKLLQASSRKPYFPKAGSCCDEFVSDFALRIAISTVPQLAQLPPNQSLSAKTVKKDPDQDVLT